MPLSRRRASPSRCGLVLTGANAATSCGQDIEADSLPTEGLLSPGTCLDMIFVIEAFPHLVNLQLFCGVDVADNGCDYAVCAREALCFARRRC